jgi:Uma2 family endonuclease
MAIGATRPATIDDLTRADGKAELIGGRIVGMSPSGYFPSLVAFEIAVSLRGYARRTGRGFATADGLGFHIPKLPSGRESFCPDAVYHAGPPPKRRMKFIEGPPTFAVEVRSEGDAGPKAEAAMSAKRADYFAAGTLVVWDVDVEREVIHVHRADAPDQPTTYTRGQEAEAEPAVPGWRVAVDAILGEPE